MHGVRAARCVVVVLLIGSKADDHRDVRPLHLWQCHRQ